jgi:pimeloyl-ACP methyl ester carboxylesterase
MATVDLTHKLADISVPTLLLAADQDVITPLAAQYVLRDTLVDAQLITYPTSGHNIAEEFADQCARDALAFLLKVSRRDVNRQG